MVVSVFLLWSVLAVETPSDLSSSMAKYLKNKIKAENLLKEIELLKTTVAAEDPQLAALTARLHAMQVKNGMLHTALVESGADLGAMETQTHFYRVMIDNKQAIETDIAQIEAQLKSPSISLVEKQGLRVKALQLKLSAERKTLAWAQQQDKATTTSSESPQ